MLLFHGVYRILFLRYLRVNFKICSDRPWGPPSLLYNGYRPFLGDKERLGRDADTSPLLPHWSIKSRAISLLPLWVVRPVQSLRFCTRVQFYFFLKSALIFKISYVIYTLRTGLLNCLNARSRGLTFRHRASCI